MGGEPGGEDAGVVVVGVAGAVEEDYLWLSFEVIDQPGGGRVGCEFGLVTTLEFGPPCGRVGMIPFAQLR